MSETISLSKEDHTEQIELYSRKRARKTLGSLGGITAEKTLVGNPEQSGNTAPIVLPLQSERLGHVLLDAPENTPNTDTAEKLAVSFTKPIEKYSAAELDRAAEKIKVNNQSLAELRVLHNFSEANLRRIIGEFIAGRSIEQAVNYEITAELQYERDPTLRRSKRNGAISALAHVAVDVIPEATAQSKTSKSETFTQKTSSTLSHVFEKVGLTKRPEIIAAGIVAAVCAVVVIFAITR